MAVNLKERHRDSAVDLLKLVALFLMVFDHAYLLLLRLPQPSVLRFFYEIVPLSPALFLFLSGYSLAVSGAYTRRKKRLFSALLFSSVSSLFFIVEHGVQFPHVPFSSGILNTIAILVILLVLFDFLPETTRFPVSLVFCVGATLLFVVLRKNQLFIFPLTSGYEPILPTLLFGICGFAFGLGKLKYPRVSVYLAGGFSAVVLVGMTFFYKMRCPLFTDVGRYILSCSLQFSKLPQYWFSSCTSGNYSVSIWNFDLSCYFYALSIVIFLLIILQHFFTLSENSVWSAILLPARYLFVHYVLHLAVLTSLYCLFWQNCLSPAIFLAVYGGTVVGIYAVSFLLKNTCHRNRHCYHGMSPE